MSKLIKIHIASSKAFASEEHLKLQDVINKVEQSRVLELEKLKVNAKAASDSNNGDQATNSPARLI